MSQSSLAGQQMHLSVQNQVSPWCVDNHSSIGHEVHDQSVADFNGVAKLAVQDLPSLLECVNILRVHGLWSVLVQIEEAPLLSALWLDTLLPLLLELWVVTDLASSAGDLLSVILVVGDSMRCHSDSGRGSSGHGSILVQLNHSISSAVTSGADRIAL